ncbi:MAG: hypothetical protein EG828_01135 [Deltaproteobacteria bacterium]|nr:hypothetical protein [Deltaproteobacteria bacterium]
MTHNFINAESQRLAARVAQYRSRLVTGTLPTGMLSGQRDTTLSEKGGGHDCRKCSNVLSSLTMA